MPLTTEQLRVGSLTYAQQSDVVDVSMKLQTGMEEAVHLVSPPGRRTRPLPVVTPQPVSTQPELAQQSEPSERKNEPDTVREPVPEPVQERKALKAFVLTGETRPAAHAPALPDPPPAVGSVVRLPLLASAPKVPLPMIAPAHLTAPRKPKSGRLIWTGSLSRHGVVEFEGSTVTVGSVLGALPGVPAKISVYPAEFKDEGLVVYMTDASRHNRTETPGPLTGWNRLFFVWDPERGKQITNLEAPNASNQFARLALRNDRRSCSVIVVDWSAE